METISIKNNNKKLFEKRYAAEVLNKKGFPIEMMLNEDEFEVKLTENFYKKRKDLKENFSVSQNIFKINKIKPLEKGNGKDLAHNINKILTLLNILGNEMELNVFDKLTEKEELELMNAENLFELIIQLAESSRKEIEKQLKYLESLSK